MANKNLVDSQTVAKIFGVTVRRIEQLKSESIIKGEGRPTKYDLLPTIQNYIKYLSDKANGREKKESVQVSENLKLDGEARIKQAKAEMEELRLKELKGNLHAAEDVEAIMNDMILNIRSMLLAMPGKLAIDLAKTETAAEASEKIRKEIYYILNCASEYRYDPDVYAERVREREGWDTLNEESED